MKYAEFLKESTEIWNKMPDDEKKKFADEIFAAGSVLDNVANPEEHQKITNELEKALQSPPSKHPSRLLKKKSSVRKKKNIVESGQKGTQFLKDLSLFRAIEKSLRPSQPEPPIAPIHPQS